MKIDSLRQVNLVSGKNNTGKSSLLEAVYLFVNKGNVSSLLDNLKGRKELKPIGRGRYADELLSQEENLRILSSLFYGRKISFDTQDRIELGEQDDRLSLRFVYYKEETKDSGSLMRSVVEMPLADGEINDLSIGLEIKEDGSSRLQTLKKHLLFASVPMGIPSLVRAQFVHTGNVDREVNSTLFDAIALTDREESVIQALQIIEPDTERIAFVDQGFGERVAVLKLSGSKDLIPLAGMGDGINRILSLILALVNSKDGYLLIDEFENGLHYTVQEQLWTIIFKLARDLNVQVFATTHSNDCIAGFSQVLNKEGNEPLGNYIRLDNVNGKIRPIAFSAEELGIAGQQEIEIR